MRRSKGSSRLFYTDLISRAREKREIEYKKLESLPLHQLKLTTNNYLQELDSHHQIIDPTLCFNYASLVYTFIKLRNDHYSSLLRILNGLNPHTDQEVEIFIQFVYAKMMKYLSRSDIQCKLDDCIEKLGFFENPISSAYFLKFLAEHSPNSILICAVQFVKATKRSIYNKSIEVKLIGYDSLRIFLQFLIRIQTPQVQPSVAKLMLSANRRSKTSNTLHGALLIFSALFETTPSMISSGYDDSISTRLLNNMNNYTPEIRGLALNVLVYLLIFDPKAFEKEQVDLIKTLLWKTNINFPTQFSTEALHRLIQKDKSQLYSHNLLPFLQISLKSKNELTVKNTFAILDEIAEERSSLINQNISQLSISLSKVVSINDTYVSNVSRLFKEFPSLWLSMKHMLQKLIDKSPEILQSYQFLSLLSKCSSLEDQTVTDHLLNLCSNQSPTIRALIPQALIAQILFTAGVDMKPINRLFTMALSDPSPYVREKVLLSFPDSSAEFLTSNSILTSLGSLIKDENCNVKAATIRLVGKIAKYNPFSAFPILRRALLDTLFLLDSAKPLLVKEETSSYFPDLLKASFDILKVYSQTICDIILRQFSFTPTRELTYFEERAILNINLNLTKAIGLIAGKDISLISQHVGQFLNFFIWVLQQHGPKEQKLAVVTTMYTILTHSGKVSGVDITRVFPSLIEIASMWNSRKLNVAVLKLMGFIGAIDYQQNQTEAEQNENIEEAMPHSDENYFMAITCRTLLNVMKDDSLIVHHRNAMDALVDIFCSSVTSGQEYFNEFMAIFLEKIKSGNTADYILVLKQICSEAPAAWVTSFAADLLELIQKLWETTAKAQLIDIIDLIPALANVLMDRFTVHISQCTSFLLRVLNTNSGYDADLSYKALMAMIALRNISSDYLFLIFPELISVTCSPGTLIQVRCYTLSALRVLVQTCDCDNFASSIIRCALQCLAIDNHFVREGSLQLIYSIMISLGSDSFMFYADYVKSVLESYHISTENFTLIFNNIKNVQQCEFDFVTTDDPSSVMTACRQKRPSVGFDEEKIVAAFNFEEEETPWNRKEWWHHLVSITLEYSPSHYIRCCSFLSNNLFHVAESLFNAAFLCCWNALSNETQCTISGFLTLACLSDQLPNSIRSSLVKLFEYMEQSEKKLEIEYSVLLRPCETASQYGKALYFAHRNFYKNPSDLKSIENLIHFSSHLGLTKTVQGLSLYVKNMTMQPYWCEQLGQWEKAKNIYLSNTDPKLAGESYKGILRCLKHQKNWDEIIERMDQFEDQTPEVKEEILPIIASALFHRQMWNKLGSILERCPRNSVSVLMIVALYETNQGRKEDSMRTISQALDILARNARTLFRHDKVALYPLLVKAQQLHEISEIASERTAQELTATWEDRIKLCRESFDVYHRILSVRLTHVSVKDMMKPSIKMLKFALKRKEIESFDSAFNFLFPNQDEWDERIEFLYIQGMWTRGETTAAVERLKTKLSVTKEQNSRHLARMFYMCGHWMLQMPASQTNTPIVAIQMLESSIKCDKNYYNAWHRWSWANSALYHQAPAIQMHAINAISGFKVCLNLKTGSTFSDLIQMVSMIFTAKLSPDNFAQAWNFVKTINPAVFLQVIPQLFVQLARPPNQVQDMVADIIMQLLPEHYHVLLYPLLLLIQSPIQPLNQSLDDALDKCGNQMAADLIASFLDSNPEAAIEGKIISDGLLLCSCTRIELWLDSISLVIRAIGNHNYKEANAILLQALALQKRHGEDHMTEKCRGFIEQIFAIVANGVFDPVKLIADLQNFYKQIKKYLETIHQVNMYLVAPHLAQLRDSKLAIPGTYIPGEHVTHIHQFHPTLDIYYSKQRPRILIICDSKGGQHRSLLKGREDLRMDQRVMQFFDLINQHIRHDFHPESRSLSIFRYNITPISKTAGLIQYVNGADTMFSLISEYRGSHGRELFEERQFIETNYIKSIDALTPIQRYEALNDAAAATPDSDIREILWLKSPSANEWVTRYIKFAQSSSLMSIVGYILGLGDRHPSNLMIHRFSGSVIHIDFSDCFEISRNRVRFPELIPFRLTRMMVSAFGPTGIEGDFRITCEETLRLVRAHRESIMAVLDIFLQEPIDNPEELLFDDEKPSETVIVGVDSDGEWSPCTIESGKTTSIKESIIRLNQKIIGRDFNTAEEYSIERQVDELLKVANNLYLKSYLYSGWTPLW